MSVTYRPPTIDDAAGIANVDVVSRQTAYRSFLPTAHLDGLSVSDTTTAWQGELQSASQYHIAVAVADRTVVGFVRAGLNDKQRAGITHLFVLPEYWGTGVGEVLMDKAMEILVELKVSTASLWAFTDNPRARRFYERLGWTLDGRTYLMNIDGEEAELVCYQKSL